MGFVSSPNSSARSSFSDHDASNVPLLGPRRSLTLPALQTPGLKRASFSSYGALPTGRSNRRVRYSSNPVPTTPGTSKRDITPQSARSTRAYRRRQTIALEADEIWEQLEEDSRSPLASPFALRSGPRSAGSISRRPRSSTGKTNSETNNDIAVDDHVTETDPLMDIEPGLMMRSNTGRMYHRTLVRGNRRRSMPAPLSEPLLPPNEEITEGEGAQDATGGWWRMGTMKLRDWIGGGEGKGKAPDRDGGENG
jgi:hypothetical protein